MRFEYCGVNVCFYVLIQPVVQIYQNALIQIAASGQKWTYRRGKNGGRGRRCEFHSRLRYFLIFFLFLAFLPLLQPTVLTVSVPVIL
jgi:hypothetical protein